MDQLTTHGLGHALQKGVQVLWGDELLPGETRLGNLIQRIAEQRQSLGIGMDHASCSLHHRHGDGRSIEHILDQPRLTLGAQFTLMELGDIDEGFQQAVHLPVRPPGQELVGDDLAGLAALGFIRARDDVHFQRDAFASQKILLGSEDFIHGLGRQHIQVGEIILLVEADFSRHIEHLPKRPIAGIDASTSGCGYHGWEGQSLEYVLKIAFLVLQSSPGFLHGGAILEDEQPRTMVQGGQLALE